MGIVYEAIDWGQFELTDPLWEHAFHFGLSLSGGGYLFSAEVIINVEECLFGLFLNAACLPIKAFMDGICVFLEFGEREWSSIGGGREDIFFFGLHAPGGEIVGIDDGFQLFYLHHNIMALHQKLFQGTFAFPSINYKECLLEEIFLHQRPQINGGCIKCTTFCY